MSIRYFNDETAFNLETPEELCEALDVLHTQVLDNFPEKIFAPFCEVLVVAMEAAHALRVAANEGEG